MSAPGYPIGILAELTHRCPLQCPYCSNPAKLLKANGQIPSIPDFTQTYDARFVEALVQ